MGHVKPGQGRRIIIVGVNYAPEPSGTAPFTASLAEHLTVRGHHVTVVTGLPHYPDWKVPHTARSVRREERNGVALSRVAHHVPSRQSLLGRLRYELSFAIRSLPRVWRHVRQGDVVVAVIPGLFSAVVAAIVCAIVRRPLVVWLQDSMTRGAAQTGLSSRVRIVAVLALLERLVFARAARIVAISEVFAEQLTGAGVPPSKIRIVRNWTFLPDSEADSCVTRRTLGWGEEWVALHAGNMGLKQGLGSVVEAARASSPGTRYVLLGAGSQLDALKERASGLDNVQFLPSAEDQDYVDILAAADALLVCERPEVSDMSLPSKLTAYARSGRPIIAFVDPRGATARELRAADCGIVVDNSGAPAELDGVVQAVRSDSEIRNRIVANGLHYANTRYSRRENLEVLEDWITNWSHR